MLFTHVSVARGQADGGSRARCPELAGIVGTRVASRRHSQRVHQRKSTDLNTSLIWTVSVNSSRFRDEGHKVQMMQMMTSGLFGKTTRRVNCHVALLPFVHTQHNGRPHWLPSPPVSMAAGRTRPNGTVHLATDCMRCRAVGGCGLLWDAAARHRGLTWADALTAFPVALGVTAMEAGALRHRSDAPICILRAQS